MYSCEDRVRAIQLHIKLGKRSWGDHLSAGLPDQEFLEDCTRSTSEARTYRAATFARNRSTHRLRCNGPSTTTSTLRFQTQDSFDDASAFFAEAELAHCLKS